MLEGGVAFQVFQTKPWSVSPIGALFFAQDFPTRFVNSDGARQRAVDN